ncbi:unnamed protein product, partial [Mesorhabditis spiculigera]
MRPILGWLLYLFAFLDASDSKLHEVGLRDPMETLSHRGKGLDSVEPILFGANSTKQKIPSFREIWHWFADPTEVEWKHTWMQQFHRDPKAAKIATKPASQQFLGYVTGLKTMRRPMYKNDERTGFNRLTAFQNDYRELVNMQYIYEPVVSLWQLPDFGAQGCFRELDKAQPYFRLVSSSKTIMNFYGPKAICMFTGDVVDLHNDYSEYDPELSPKRWARDVSKTMRDFGFVESNEWLFAYDVHNFGNLGFYLERPRLSVFVIFCLAVLTWLRYNFDISILDIYRCLCWGSRPRAYRPFRKDPVCARPARIKKRLFGQRSTARTTSEVAEELRFDQHYPRYPGDPETVPVSQRNIQCAVCNEETTVPGTSYVEIECISCGIYHVDWVCYRMMLSDRGLDATCRQDQLKYDECLAWACPGHISTIQRIHQSGERLKVLKLAKRTASGR